MILVTKSCTTSACNRGITMLPRAWLLPMANLLITLVLSTMMISRVLTSGPPGHLGETRELVNLCGLFSIHYRIVVDDSSLTAGPIRERCSNYHILSYLRARSMMFAVEEINNRSDFLPNVSLTYEIHDICNRKSIGLQACMDCLRLVNSSGPQTYSPADLPKTNEPSLVIIGPDTSESAITMADFLQIFGVPLISYSATSTLLSNREKYRTFFRTVPDDGYQTVVIADIIRHYGWNWIAIIAVDNSYGRSAMNDFLLHASKRGICVAFQLVVGETMGYGDMQRLFRDLETFPELEVVVAFTYSKTLLPFLERTEMNSTPNNVSPRAEDSRKGFLSRLSKHRVRDAFPRYGEFGQINSSNSPINDKQDPWGPIGTGRLLYVYNMGTVLVLMVYN